MVATRDFWWTVVPSREFEWTRRQLAAVLKFYDERPELLNWDITQPVFGNDYLQMRLRVVGRDRHAASQLAQDIAVTAMIRAKAKGVPFSQPLPPHRNRGKRKPIGAAKLASASVGTSPPPEPAADGGPATTA